MLALVRSQLELSLVSVLGDRREGVRSVLGFVSPVKRVTSLCFARGSRENAARDERRVLRGDPRSTTPNGSRRAPLGGFPCVDLVPVFVSAAASRIRAAAANLFKEQNDDHVHPHDPLPSSRPRSAPHAPAPPGRPDRNVVRCAHVRRVNQLSGRHRLDRLRPRVHWDHALPPRGSLTTIGCKPSSGSPLDFLVTDTLHGRSAYVAAWAAQGGALLLQLETALPFTRFPAIATSPLPNAPLIVRRLRA